MNNTESVVDLAAKAMLAHTVAGPDGRTFLVVPEKAHEREVSDPHGLKPQPKYISQAVTLQTVDSLVGYTNRFKSEPTILFADISANSITATIDYHSKEAASNVTHRATMTLPFSEEWRLWTGISGKLQGQLEFARFLEENGADVFAPSGGELLDSCRDLQAHRKVNFTKAVRTASDNENFEFTADTEAKTKGGIELPTKFQLKIPVYFGEPDTDLFAFLRWKLDPDNGGLTLGIQLHRTEHVRQAVFKQIVLSVADRTGCPVVFGKAG